MSSADLWLAALVLDGLLAMASGVPRLLQTLGFLLRFSPHSLFARELLLVLSWLFGVRCEGVMGVMDVLGVHELVCVGELLVCVCVCM